MNPLARKIAEEIRGAGPIPVARFMELALYCPEYGYYEKEEDIVGKAGDFYTSVSVGPLFGHLLAFEFGTWLSELGADSPALVEAGAHNGQLAADILAALRETHPQVFRRLRYWIVEPSKNRRAWQERKLGPFASSVAWARDLSELKAANSNGISGLIFANELLDAMPIRRFGWGAHERRWFEWGVTVESERFAWAPMPGDIEVPDWIRALPPRLLDVLPNGFLLEHSDSALIWWGEAAGCLSRGRLVAFDYGFEQEEFLVPERPNGTLRAYCQHQVCADVLANPGDQDLTAHVNFTNIQAAGITAGLTTYPVTSQARFLTSIAARLWEQQAAYGGWSAHATRQFRTLTHPQFLGTLFKVLVQER